MGNLENIINFEHIVVFVYLQYYAISIQRLKKHGLWPYSDPVLVLVQSVQRPLLIHSQLNVTEFSALWHQLNLYTQPLFIWMVFSLYKIQIVKMFSFCSSQALQQKNLYICILIKNIRTVQFYQETYQVRQVLSASHFTELFHGVKGNTVPRHQPASLCEEQNKELNSFTYWIKSSAEMKECTYRQNQYYWMQVQNIKKKQNIKCFTINLNSFPTHLLVWCWYLHPCWSNQ